jgi:hypothetical protein
MTEEEFDRELHAAYVETENEIADYAFGRTPLDNNGDRELEQVEGWDGQPLSNLEGMAAAAMPDENNYDRPLERDEMAALRREKEAMREERDQWKQVYDEWLAQPQREEQQKQTREKVNQFLLERGVVTVDDNAHDALVGELVGGTNRIQQLEAQLMNNSFLAAKEKYGEDEFHQAYDALLALDMRNPAAQGIRAQIMGDADPGERLMEMGNNPLMQGLRHHAAPPFMPANYRRAYPSTRPRVSHAAQSRGAMGWQNPSDWPQSGGDETDQAGAYSRAVNDDVFDYAMSDD